MPRKRKSDAENGSPSENTGGSPPGANGVLIRRRKGPLPGLAKLKTRDEIRRELAKLYILGRRGDPEYGQAPLPYNLVNALTTTLSLLLADLRFEEGQAAKLRDEVFERELQEMVETMEGYREILVSHGLLDPANPAGRTH